jgi:hypothetical protein
LDLLYKSTYVPEFKELAFPFAISLKGYQELRNLRELNSVDSSKGLTPEEFDQGREEMLRHNGRAQAQVFNDRKHDMTFHGGKYDADTLFDFYKFRDVVCIAHQFSILLS